MHNCISYGKGCHLAPYFLLPVKEVEIKKEAGAGVRKLGIPTILDRIAQAVVKTHLELIAEPHFHEYSYGYRPG